MTLLGKRLKEARENKRLTQMEASKLLGISNGTLSGYERDYRDPDTAILEKMADLFDVSIDYLLGRSSVLQANLREELKETASKKESVYFLDMEGLSEEDILEVKKHIEFLRFKANQVNDQMD